MRVRCGGGGGGESERERDQNGTVAYTCRILSQSEISHCIMSCYIRHAKLLNYAWPVLYTVSLYYIDTLAVNRVVSCLIHGKQTDDTCQ